MATGTKYDTKQELLDAVERVKKNSQQLTTSEKIQKNDKDIIESMFDERGVETVTGDGVDNADPKNPVLSYESAESIKLKYESNDNTNAFTDAEKEKLANFKGFIEWTTVENGDGIILENDKGYTFKGTVDSTWLLPAPDPANETSYVGVKNSSDFSLGVNQSNGEFLVVLNAGDSFIFSYEQESSKWQIVSDYKAPIPVTAAQAIFYVDGNVGLSGDGSFLAPFKTLEDGRDAVIGTGAIDNPQYLKARVEVLNGDFVVGGNFFVRDITWNFAETVTVNYTSTDGSYMFDASVYNAQTLGNCEFSILGGLSWVTSSSNNGFFKSTQYSYVSTLNFQIDAVIRVKSIIRGSDAGTYPLIFMEGFAGNMLANGRGLNNLEFYLEERIRVNDENNTDASCIHIGEGQRFNMYGGELGTGSFSGHGSDPIRVLLDGSMFVEFHDVVIQGGDVNSYIKMQKEIFSAHFYQCSFQVSQSINNGVVGLRDDFSIGNRGYTLGSGRNGGILFSQCVTLGSNASSFILRNTTGTEFYVDFINNDFSANYDTNDVAVGYYIIAGAATPQAPVRTNSFLGKLRYSNIPTSTSGLNPGDVWSNVGVLTIF